MSQQIKHFLTITQEAPTGFRVARSDELPGPINHGQNLTDTENARCKLSRQTFDWRAASLLLEKRFD
jgi:hypothetical protein